MSSNKDNMQVYQNERYVSFDLPFIINVSDSMDDAVLRDWLTKKSSGEEELPFSPYAPRPDDRRFRMGVGPDVFLPSIDDIVAPYQVDYHGCLVQVFLLRRINPCQHGIAHLGLEVPGDTHGRRAFSTITVNFCLDDFKEEVINESEKWVDMTLEVVNFFINCYRYIYQKPSVHCIMKSEIQRFHFNDILSDGKETENEWGTSDGPGLAFVKTDKTEEDNDLRDMLQTSKGPNYYQIFRLDVMRLLSAGETHLAVILSEVMFENWIYSYLDKKYKEIGLSQTEFEEKLLDKHGNHKSITRIVEENIQDVSGYKFKETHLCKDWKIKTRNKRNDVVHKGLYRIPNEEAKEAFLAAIHAIQEISKH